MKHDMILSASGWRKVFAKSGDGEDATKHIGRKNGILCALIAKTFAQYMTQATGKKAPVVVLGKDTRPTGDEIADIILRTLLGSGIKVQYIGTASAPEIMAYAKKLDGFIYVSASHNPIGHNGIKFGLRDGGVLSKKESKKLAKSFEEKCSAVNVKDHSRLLMNSASEREVAAAYKASAKYKKASLEAYEEFIRAVITGSYSPKEQDEVFARIGQALKKEPLTVVCDMNGSSRTLCIDKAFLTAQGMHFEAFNDTPGQIAHAIIPEPENLVHCAAKIREMQANGMSDVKLGYMPDCDGDRGNIVCWNEKRGEAKAIPAQAVFALSVMAELSFELWRRNLAPQAEERPLAVAVNGPTSMRVDDIARAFGAQVFRAEVGEANVVTLARKKRDEGYCVRILGEGSNGGNITYPSSVRDPLATLFAIIKLLTIKDAVGRDGTVQKGLFHLWCEKSGQEDRYKETFTLTDIMATLPRYTTTGVSESRALLDVRTADKAKLKLRFEKLFKNEWALRKDELRQKYGIAGYDAVTTNGTKEVTGADDWCNGTGGLKVRFFDEGGTPVAFIWMRPSGTEPVFRILCDVKGKHPNEEQSLLEWESSLISKADSIEDDSAMSGSSKNEVADFLAALNSQNH